jgi:hypothetical protein
MVYTLYAGTCEQFKYTLKATNISQALKEVRKILTIPENKKIRHVTSEYVQGSELAFSHYAYTEDSIFKKRGNRRTFLLVHERSYNWSRI